MAGTRSDLEPANDLAQSVYAEWLGFTQVRPGNCEGITAVGSLVSVFVEGTRVRNVAYISIYAVTIEEEALFIGFGPKYSPVICPVSSIQNGTVLVAPG